MTKIGCNNRHPSQANIEWRKSGQKASVMAKARLTAGKVTATVFLIGKIFMSIFSIIDTLVMHKNIMYRIIFKELASFIFVTG